MWSSLSNRRAQYAIIAIIICAILVFQAQQTSHTTFRPSYTQWAEKHFPRDDTKNRSLGFHSILAVSKSPSWRTRGLQAAAQLTGLDVEIPPQPHISDQLIEWIQKMPARADAGMELKRGSAIAWLAHLDMLRYVIASEHATALIVEDDVDWDVDLKSQMALVSDNVHRFLATEPKAGWPYAQEWDVMWIGHCGERAAVDVPYVQYKDTHRILPEHYTGWAKPWWTPHIPLDHRRVQIAVQPVCTFAYAVTADSAQRILSLLDQGGGEAYDVLLQKMCSHKRLRCIVVNPQLMVHHQLPPGLGHQSEVRIGDGKGVAGDPSKLENAKGSTANIVESARCKALFGSTCLFDVP